MSTIFLFSLIWHLPKTFIKHQQYIREQKKKFYFSNNFIHLIDMCFLEKIKFAHMRLPFALTAVSRRFSNLFFKLQKPTQFLIKTSRTTTTRVSYSCWAIVIISNIIISFIMPEMTVNVRKWWRRWWVQIQK